MAATARKTKPVTDRWKSKVPEGESGDWRVARFSVSKEESDATRLRQMFSGRGFVPVGEYTKLMHGGTIVMSDTPDELDDHRYAIARAKGHVLVNGLGLGCYLSCVLAKPEVTAVTIVEQSADVIKLVAGHFLPKHSKQLEIIHASAFDWKPPTDAHYGFAWHDIWDFICGDNVPEMAKLKRKYARKAELQGCWCEYQAKRGR